MIEVKPLKGNVHANMATKYTCKSMFAQFILFFFIPPAFCIGKNTIFYRWCPPPPPPTPPRSERTYFLNGPYDIITTADVIVLQGMKLCILLIFGQTVPFFIYFNNKFLRLHNILSFNSFLIYKFIIYRIRVFKVITSHFQ